MAWPGASEPIGNRKSEEVAAAAVEVAVAAAAAAAAEAEAEAEAATSYRSVMHARHGS